MKKTASQLLALLLVFLLVLTGCNTGGDTSSAVDPDDSISTEEGENNQDNNQTTTKNQQSNNKTTAGKTTAKDKVTTKKQTTTTTGSEFDMNDFFGGGSDADIEAIMEDLAKEKAWKQKKFYISAFSVVPELTSEEGARKCVETAKEAGITLAENGIIAIADMERAIEYYEEVGMDYLVSGYGRFTNGATGNFEKIATSVVEDYCAGEHFIGYFLWDEPGTTENFNLLKKWQNAFQKLTPGKLCYSLLLPSYGAMAWNPSDYNGSAYKKYVDNFVNIVDPPILSFDYYPIKNSKTSLVENNMWADMGLFRKHSKGTDKPFWFYFQACQVYGNNTPTDSQIKAQMYGALSYGVKTLSYWGATSSIYDKDGKKSSRFNFFKGMNKKVQNLGDLLFDKKYGNIYHTGLSASNNSFYSLDDPNTAPYSAAPDKLIVSTFTDNSGTYMVIVNKDTNNAVSGTMTLKSSKKISKFNLETGKFGSASNGSSISLSLAAGECDVYKLA